MLYRATIGSRPICTRSRLSAGTSVFSTWSSFARWPCQFGGQPFEHLVGLLGRPCVRGLDHFLQRGDAVVEPNRVVERVLRAPVPHLVDGLFDLRQPSKECACRRRECGWRAGAEAIRDLRSEVADADHGPIGLASPGADLARELVLRPQVGVRDVSKPRVFENRKRLFKGRPVDVQPHAIGSGRHQRAPRGIRAAQDHSRESRGPLGPQVPANPVEAALPQRRSGKTPETRARPVEDLQRDRGRRRPQEEVDVRGAGSPVRRPRRKQMHGGVHDARVICRRHSMPSRT